MNKKNLTKLAIIPARGGSTRLKNKNIRLLGGKPLIRWAVENVINSKCFDKIIISTDSDEIFDAVKDLPVERHIRPNEFATTKSTVLTAMINLIENLTTKYDIVSYFLPTSPFVNEKYVIEGIDLIKQKNVDSVIAVHEYESPIQLACIRKGNNLIPIFDNLTAGLTNSKFIQKYYKPSGSFYISTTKHLLKQKNFFKGNNIKSVLIPNDLLVDIDYERDIHYAEYLYQNYISKK